MFMGFVEIFRSEEKRGILNIIEKGRSGKKEEKGRKVDTYGGMGCY